MLAAALFIGCLFECGCGRRVQVKIGGVLHGSYQKAQTSLDHNIASTIPQSLAELAECPSNLRFMLRCPFKAFAWLPLPFKNRAAGRQFGGRSRPLPTSEARVKNVTMCSVILVRHHNDIRDRADSVPASVSQPPAQASTRSGNITMHMNENIVTRRLFLSAVTSLPLLAASATSAALPVLQVRRSIVFSKHTQYQSGRTDGSIPCVVFFPGDLSDIAVNMPRQLPGEYCLEAIHEVIAGRFPDYDIVTIRGELDIEKFRTFKDFVSDPYKAIDNLEDLLKSVRGSDADYKIVIVGFSRGGMGVSSLINGAESHPDFWRRVEAIHYIDAGGVDSYVSSRTALQALLESNKEVLLNFQSTNYTANAVNSTGRNGMITLAKDVGLPVNVQKASGNTLEDHFNLLSTCNFERPKYVGRKFTGPQSKL